MTEQYASALDNPNITLQHALDYYQQKKTIEQLEKEISRLNEETGFVPVIKEELSFRLMQILFLTNNISMEDMIPCHMVITAIFKMAMPQHRLTVEANNQMERKVAIKLLNNGAEYLKNYFKYTHSNLNIFDKHDQEIIKAVSRALIWTGSPVGQGLYQD